MGDIKGECKAHGHLGAVHMSLGNYTNAMKCYEEQLERAKELKVERKSVYKTNRIKRRATFKLYVNITATYNSTFKQFTGRSNGSTSFR